MARNATNLRRPLQVSYVCKFAISSCQILWKACCVCGTLITLMNCFSKRRNDGMLIREAPKQLISRPQFLEMLRLIKVLSKKFEELKIWFFDSSIL